MEKNIDMQLENLPLIFFSSLVSILICNRIHNGTTQLKMLNYFAFKLE